MTALITYEIMLDSARTATYAAAIDDVTAVVATSRFGHGMDSAYQEVSAPAMGVFELVNHDGRFDVENPLAAYYGKLARGTLVRVRATFAGVTQQLYEGRISRVVPTLGEGRPKRVTLITECPMRALADAEFKPELLTDVTADVAIAPIFDNAVVTYPYAGTFWLLGVAGHSELGVTTKLYDHDAIDFDTGITVFEFTGDNLGGEAGLAAQSFIRDLVAAELGGRFFFDARTGKFKFHNRHRDILNTTVSAEVARQDAEEVDYIYGDDVFNKVTVNFRPREVGAAGSVLWAQTSLPITLSANATRLLTARYRDPDIPSARVGGMDFIQPQAGVDYVANQAADSSLGDVTGYLAVSVAFGAASADVGLVNQSGGTIYVTALQLRGTPITIYDKQFVTAVNGASIGANGLIEETRQLNALSDADLAQNYADLLVARFGTAGARIARYTFDANRSETHAAQMLNRTLGQRIRLTDDGANKDYILVGEQHEILGGANADVPASHRVTWIPEPHDSRSDYWLLGVAGYSELGAATRLAL